MNRLDWDTTWLLVAGVIAKRSRCVRFQTGTVIVSSSNRVVATGYIGPAAGFVRDTFDTHECVTFVNAGGSVVATNCTEPETEAAPDTSECATFCDRGRLGPTDETRLSYSDCVSTHSEMNALLVCDRADREGGSIYVTSVPCWTCAKAIANSGVARAVIVDTSNRHAYRDPEVSLQHLRDCGIVVTVIEMTKDLTVDVEEPHDHAELLNHLRDEWGTRGVILQLLEPLDTTKALDLIEVLRRDVTDSRVVEESE